MPRSKKPAPHRTPRPNTRDKIRYIEFARAYLDYGANTFCNGFRSAIAVGYTEKNANATSYKLLGKPGVQAEMKRLRDERSRRSTIVGPVEALELISSMARVLPCELMENGELIALDRMSKEQASAIAGVKTITRTTVSGEDILTEVRLEYRLIDRLKAIELIARHWGLFEKDNEQQKAEPQPLVLMTAKPLTLSEWSEQAELLQEQMKKRQLEVKK